jgi:GTPase-associated system-like protein
MSETILQSYLNEQHIKTDVQENIDNLKKAVNEVKKHLTRKKANSDIVPFTLVALDPKVKDTDPVVQLVEGIIKKKWPAFKNSVTATKDKSTTYVRAVILESLSQLAKKNPTTAALVWLTARDVIRYYQLGSEESVISRLLQELADQTEENGKAEWGISQNLQEIEFKGAEIIIPGIKAAQIDEEALKKHLLDANVHSAYSSQAGGGKNPHGFRDHNSWQYFQFMSENAAKGIMEVVDSALIQQTKSLSSISSLIQKSLDSYFAQLQPFLKELNQAFANRIAANNKRSELLWWKQSLYSRSLNASYRSLDKLNAAVAIALDLAEQVVGFYPESVDYLLRETLKDVHSEQVEEERLLSDWLKDSNNLHRVIQSALNKHAAKGDERKPFLSAWANVVKSGETTDFFTETGIDKKAKMTVSDLAVWLFHGLQAQKLATAK